MDMWDTYIAGIKTYVPKAEKKIVDGFHIMKHVWEAVDEL